MLALLASPAIMGMIGFIFRFIATWIENSHERKLADARFQFQREIALRNQDFKFQTEFNKSEENPGTRTTRRILAMFLVGTVCFVAVLWAFYPDVVLYRWIDREPHHYSFLIFSWETEAGQTVVETTGGVVYRLLDLCGFVIGSYFAGSTRK